MSKQIGSRWTKIQEADHSYNPSPPGSMMSDEVSQFLKDAKELRDQQDEADKARSKELEEKILQAKRERQARREERARSISPQKSSPANTPPPLHHRRSIHGSDDLNHRSSPIAIANSIRPETETAEAAMPYSTSPSKENDSPFDPDPDLNHRPGMTSPTSGPLPGRTLSWQRRPTFQASEKPRSRPLSMVAAENARHRMNIQPSHPSDSEQAFATEPTVAKDQIFQPPPLSGDPTWLKHMTDRDLTSAAYGQGQGEGDDQMDVDTTNDQPLDLGMASPEPSKRDSHLSRPTTPGRLNSSPSIFSNAQKLDAPLDEDISPTDAAAAPTSTPMSPPSGRTSPSRPVSPTKGLGGFVQSAMMKRSGSVKRWSVTSPHGLGRADSTVSHRGGSNNRDGTTTSLSRPTSRHGVEEKEAEPVAATRAAPAESRESKPDLVLEDEEQPSPLVSPSRTMDPRRWSPTKSSWLEAALNKPDSLKPKSNLTSPPQPAWMVELNKAKAQKASNPAATEPPSSTGSSSQKHAVNIGGLMRSSPMGGAGKPAVSGLGGVHSPPAVSTASFVPTATSIGLRGSKSKGNLGADAEVDAGTAATSPTLDTRSKSESSGKDFRANLKPRQPTADSKSGGDSTSEFKQVFGTLRKTKREENHAAPDQLKDNILRGKAALNNTGGPKKTERVDAFKDAILKKKSEFQKAQTEGKGIAASLKPLDEQASVEDPMRHVHATLGRPANNVRRGSAADIRETRPGLAENAGFAHRRLLSEAAPKLEPSVPDVPLPAVSGFTLPNQRGHAPSGSITSRFPTNLATMIARGPPAGATRGSKGQEDLKSSESLDVPPSGPQLTHMTKNRARGPRRKAPAAVATTTLANMSPELRSNGAYERHGEAKKEFTREGAVKRRPVAASASAQPSARQSIHAQVAAQATLRKSPPTRGLEQDTDPFSPTESAPSFGDMKSHSPVKPFSTLLSSLEKQPGPAAQEHRSRTPSPLKLGRRQMPDILDEPPDIVRSPEPTKEGRFAAFDGASISSTIRPRSRSRSPTKVAALLPGIGSPEKLALDHEVDSEPVLPIRVPAATSEEPEPPKEESVPIAEGRTASRALPQPPSRNRSLSRPATSHSMFKSPESRASSRPGSPTRSPTKQAIEASSLLNSFFDGQKPKRDYRADAAEILLNRPKGTSKIRTVSTTLCQLFGDGTKIAVPTHNERELFEQQMYLCAHTFLDEGGKRVSELYFWAGHEVPQSAAEDAEIYAWRESKASGGSLIKLRQGKETGEFLQALGGTVITRRGSSNRYDSLAPSMLCGRRFMGQVTFDEVNFSASSLCSGFPFLITHSGRAYLWIGKGSDVDELGCARLVGMDLTLTGELEEIADGNEPATFWDIFSDGGPKSSSADHWKLKPNYDKYCARLFFSDPDSAQQVVEISPFSQTDLRPTSIYVLDAFFEMYIIVGRQAQPQYLAFRTALEFAQEYAILASGMEDRPFIPISTVVLEGMPRDLKSVFRTWRDGESPTVTPATATPGPGGGLRRGRSLRILPLTHALQALKE